MNTIQKNRMNPDFPIHSIRILVVLSLFLLSIMNVFSQDQNLSPREELWTQFILTTPDSSVAPEDNVMGILANRTLMTPLEISALDLCNSVFQSLLQGIIPQDTFLPEFRSPLTRELTLALDSNKLSAGIRYGQPIARRDTLIIPIRLSGNGVVEYGNLYLRRSGGEWYIEQWELYLIPFIVENGN